jgi:hypothetical protein
VSVLSRLEVPGGRGQVVTDEALVSYPVEGVASLPVTARRGEIRFDAQIVAADAPGRWRFEIGRTDESARRSLRVISGRVVQLTADSVTFALEGRSGERLSFTVEVTQ